LIELSAALAATLSPAAIAAARASWAIVFLSVAFNAACSTKANRSAIFAPRLPEVKRP
jgi:hypothetical protein